MCYTCVPKDGSEVTIRESNRELVIKARTDDPYATLQSIANQVGITRQMAWKILKSENLPTKAIRIHKSRRKHDRDMRKKHDHDMIWKRHIEMGLGPVRLSELLHIPLTSIENILKKKRLQEGYKTKDKRIHDNVELQEILLPFWTGTFNDKQTYDPPSNR
jgi:hypothetical protein